VFGSGSLYDENRLLIKTGEFKVHISEIALAETNHISGSEAKTALIIMAVITAGVAIFCLANPKTCFGSCPTYYANSGGSEPEIQVETFSRSILPCMESKDIDALYTALPNGNMLELELRNEAFETHVIKYAHVLAAPKPAGGHIFKTTDGKFFEAIRTIKPDYCLGSEGDFSAEIENFDRRERLSEADSANLAAKEEVFLHFSGIKARNTGLAFGLRQSQMNTFLFYQTLAYMGESIGDFMAQIERGDENMRAAIEAADKTLGKIDVFVKGSNGEWVSAGTIGEEGPISTDVEMIALPDLGADSVDIKLVMAKGLWRLDYIALAELGKEIKPVRLLPFAVVEDDTLRNDIKELLTDTTSQLVNYPGARYTLIYE
jgi:hypothetical protein